MVDTHKREPFFDTGTSSVTCGKTAGKVEPTLVVAVEREKVQHIQVKVLSRSRSLSFSLPIYYYATPSITCTLITLPRRTHLPANQHTDLQFQCTIYHRGNVILRRLFVKPISELKLTLSSIDFPFPYLSTQQQSGQSPASRPLFHHTLVSHAPSPALYYLLHRPALH